MDDRVRTAVRSELDTIKVQLADIQQCIASAITLASEAKSIAIESKGTASEALATANEAMECAHSAKSANDDVLTKLNQLENENISLRENQLRLEAYSRRNNIIFEAVPESTRENVLEKITNILNKMGVDPTVSIIACHRFGPTTLNRPRSIIVKFLEYEVRSDVWKKRRSLSGNTDKVWIKEDYPSVIADRRKILTPYLQAAFQGDPKNPKGRVSAYMTLDKLIINRQTFTHDTVHLIPEYIRSRVENRPCIKSNESVTVFFTSVCKLSNFHDSKFTIDGRPYANVEQRLCEQKALLFGANDIAHDIMEISDAAHIKRLAKTVKNFNDSTWKEHAPDILQTALAAKFTQDESMKAALLATGDTVLGEASPTDIFFGIGLSLSNPMVTNQHKWRGNNLLGKTLMQIRTSISNDEL